MTGSDKRKKECIVRSAVQWHYFRYCAMCEALRKHSEKGRGGGRYTCMSLPKCKARTVPLVNEG